MVTDDHKLQNPTKHIKCLPGLHSEIRGGHSCTVTGLCPEVTQIATSCTAVRFFKIETVRGPIYIFLICQSSFLMLYFRSGTKFWPTDGFFFVKKKNI